MIQANDSQLDANCARVLKAISDPRWDFRTIKGIARETGISATEVAEALDALIHFGKARQSAVSNRDGDALFTLGSKPVSARESLAEMRSFFG